MKKVENMNDWVKGNGKREKVKRTKGKEDT